MATFTEEALKQKINDLIKMKTRELKELCTLLKLKKSRYGVSDKFVLRTIILNDWLKDFDLDYNDIFKDYPEIKKKIIWTN